MSATYAIFRQMFLTGEVGARVGSHGLMAATSSASSIFRQVFPAGEVVARSGAAIPVHAALIASSYSFNAAHDSYAAHVAPHAISDLSATIPWDPRAYRLPPAAFTNGPYETLTPPGATAIAIVVWSPITGTPWFYLDAETFPGLPAVTLGGAVEYDGAGGVAVVG